MTKARFNRYLSWFTFVQTSSFLMFFGINLSFFFFVQLFFSTARRRLGTLFRLNSSLKLMVALFMIGAILSTTHKFWDGNDLAFINSLKVLPNYIYWGVLVLLLVMFSPRSSIDYARLFRAISIAVVAVVTYYVLLQTHISHETFFKHFGSNNVSLLLICYAPYLVYYARRHVHPAAALVLLAALLFLELNEGRRAGFLLVLLGGMSAYFVTIVKLNSLGHLVRLMLVTLVGLGLLYTGAVESLIRGQSDRIHQFIYAPSFNLSEDRSYLTRMAMVEKGFALFRDNVFFGVGLNNFTSVETRIAGNFDGAEYVVDKDIFERFSSHNSYITILAEGGLALTIPFGAILLILLFKGLRHFGQLKDPEKVIVFSFCTMCVHLYFTNGIVNSLVWFNIGLLAYVVSLPRRNAGSVRAPVRPYIGSRPASGGPGGVPRIG